MRHARPPTYPPDVRSRWRWYGAVTSAALIAVGVPPERAMTAREIPRVTPYVDMGHYPTPSLSQLSQESGLRGFSLGFITGIDCRASWFGVHDPRSGWQRDEIARLRNAGGEVRISFGGAKGLELARTCADEAALAAEYNAVVQAYGLTHLDVDIEKEALHDEASIHRRSRALAMVQRDNPGLRISLTLPVSPTGLTEQGMAVVRSAQEAGVVIDVVNVMTMHFGQPTSDVGKLAIQAAQATHEQLRTLHPDRSDAELWRMLGVTALLGRSPITGEMFDRNAARVLVEFAEKVQLGMLAFWEMGLDRNAVADPPQEPYEFSRIFAGFADRNR